LTYTPLESLSVEHQVALAAEVSLAAIVGEGIYSFGELLQHPVVTKLHDTPKKWLSGEGMRTQKLLSFSVYLVHARAQTPSTPSP
jgi:hypothetical protein